MTARGNAALSPLPAAGYDAIAARETNWTPVAMPAIRWSPVGAPTAPSAGMTPVNRQLWPRGNAGRRV